MRSVRWYAQDQAQVSGYSFEPRPWSKFDTVLVIGLLTFIALLLRSMHG